MLIELSKFTNMPLGSFEEGSLIGMVKNIIIDPEEQKIIGFAVIEANKFLPKLKIVSLQDVVDIDSSGVVIRNREALVERDEIVRVSKILKTKFSLIGLKAYCKPSEKIGWVNDGLVDTSTGDIMRVYVKNFFKSFVFEKSRIEKITYTGIFFKPETKEKSKQKSKVFTEKLAESV